MASSFKVYRPDGTYIEIPCTRHLMVRNGGFFPAVVKLDSGELLAIVRGGAGHVGKKGRLDLIRSRDSGESWTAPVAILDSDEDDRNPVLGQLDDGTLVLSYSCYWAYGIDEKHPDGEPKHEAWFTRSIDAGHTWEEPKRVPVPPGFAATGSPGGGQKAIQLADGTAIFTGGLCRTINAPVYGEPALFRSSDNGRTWGDCTLFSLGVCDEEVALLELPSGRLLSALRGGGIQGAATWVSESDDAGRTWSRPARKITDEWHHPADLLLLSDGAVLMTFGSRHPPFGVRALLSHDQGRTWDNHHAIVFVDNCDGTDCGYPTTIGLPDGFLLTVYYRTSSKEPYFEGLGDTWIAAAVKYREEDILSALSM
jgi:hypothetical protein